MANSIGNYTLRVSPEVLQAKAGEITSKISALQNLCDELFNKVDRSSSYWKGDASDTFRKNFKKKKSDVEKMIKAVKSYADDLNSIASVYTGVEKINVQIAEALASDIIV